MWPELHCRQFEISPSTTTAANVSSISPLSEAVSSLTDRGWRRAAGRSSKGRPGMVAMSARGRRLGDERLDVVMREPNPLDSHGPSGIFVGVDQHAVQTRIFARRLE